jgi:hypothetical protein
MNIVVIISGPTVLVSTLTASHWRFRNLSKTIGRTPLDELSPTRTTQHRNTKTNIHASSGIRTHDSDNQAAKTYALDCADTGTGIVFKYSIKICILYMVYFYDILYTVRT